MPPWRTCRIAFTAGILAPAITALLYFNEIQPRPLSFEGTWLYLAVLSCPSVGYWLLVFGFGQPCTTRTIGGWSRYVGIAALLVIGSALTLIMRSSYQYDPPASFALITASYIYGMVLFLAALVWSPLTRRYLLHNRLLAKLGLGSTLFFWVAGLFTYLSTFDVFRTRSGSRLYGVLVISFLLTLFVDFLCLLNAEELQEAGCCIPTWSHSVFLAF